ncbi:MAG: hypothetical protein EOO56_03465 [Hymenobacter sp.]|nr:MAG: hypothetical protein EOO56_03465 [Hymenobacter sp.]
MQITHRAPAAAPALTDQEPLAALIRLPLDKAPRLSCCCRISELLPLMRQAHDAARAAREAGEQTTVAA